MFCAVQKKDHDAYCGRPKGHDGEHNYLSGDDFGKFAEYLEKENTNA